MSSIPSGSLYCIPAVSAEKERLKTQYSMKKNVYGLSGAIPPVVAKNLNKFTHILDIAAGTCVWTLDLANSPEVKSRLNSKQPRLNLYACDINMGFFPDKSVTDQLGITTFQQDITKPFEESLYGLFDLVHISFLAICLTESGWELALDNCRRLLKPGGTLFIDELDTVFYRPNEVPSLEAHGHQLDLCMTGDDWLKKTNCIYAGFSVHRGFLVNLTYLLPSMLESFGFRVTTSQRGIAPAGKVCRTQRGVGGASLAEYESFTVQCMNLIFEHQAALMLKEGVLEAPRGTKITTDAEMKELLRVVADGFTNEGAVAITTYFIAQKC